jgi:hypothetical protein
MPANTEDFKRGYPLDNQNLYLQTLSDRPHISQGKREPELIQA